MPTPTVTLPPAHVAFLQATAPDRAHLITAAMTEPELEAALQAVASAAQQCDEELFAEMMLEMVDEIRDEALGAPLRARTLH